MEVKMQKDENDFGKMPLWVMGHNKISFGSKVLYAALNYHGRNEERDCFPTNQMLADNLKTSVRNITRLLGELKRGGLIEFECKSESQGYKRYIRFLRKTACNC